MLCGAMLRSSAATNGSADGGTCIRCTPKPEAEGKWTPGAGGACICQDRRRDCVNEGVQEWRRPHLLRARTGPPSWQDGVWLHIRLGSFQSDAFIHSVRRKWRWQLGQIQRFGGCKQGKSFLLEDGMWRGIERLSKAVCDQTYVSPPCVSTWGTP